MPQRARPSFNMHGLPIGKACRKGSRKGSKRMDKRVRRSSVFIASSLLPLLAVAAAGAATTAAPAPTLFGFTPDQGAAEHALEQRFDGDINAADLRGWL